MSQNNTPEFNHYQHSAPEYTEEVLWHRVYAVAAAGVLVLALVVWGIVSLVMSGGDETAPTLDITTLSPAGAIPEGSHHDSSVVENTAALAEKPAEVAQAEAPSEPVVPEHDANNIQTEEAKVASTPAPTETPVVAASPAPATTSTPSTPEPRAPEPSTLTNTPAPAAVAASNQDTAEYAVSVSIRHDDISQAALTNTMDGLEPAKALATAANVGDGFLKLYFFTDLNGRAGDTLTYSWYRNDKRIARVRVPVGSDRWRSHASKNISTNMRSGDWKVVVTDRKGNTLAHATFRLPESAT